MTKFFTKISNNIEPQDEEFYDEQPIVVEEQVQEELLPENNSSVESEEEWIDKENVEGQLSVDVFQTKENLIIKSTIAGVKSEEIDIAIENDMVTIRGQRKMEETIKDEDYFYQECYWGNFSRSIVLPMEVKADEADASLKNGVLTIILPKTKSKKSIAVKVKED